MIGALLLAAAALPALASAPLAKKEFARPPYAGAYEPQGVDERGLWMQADEEERVLRDTALVDRDPAINAYLRSVLCRTIGFDRCQSVRIYLIKESTFNASMTPNGTMRVHTGLLARIQSEAEL
ncbi:MAG TPA: peptidase M48, partial [Novosphingobium sp.]